MPSDMKHTAQHWSEHTARFSGRNAGLFWWEAGPEMQRHINNRISGNPTIDWVAYILDKYFDSRLPLTRCLSLGCGNGHLERRLAQFGAFQHCDAYDVAEGSIQTGIELERALFKKVVRWFISRLADKLKDGDLIGVIRRRLRAYQARVIGRNIERQLLSFPHRAM